MYKYIYTPTYIYTLVCAGDFRAAIAEYSTSIGLDASNFKAWFNRGFAYDKLGRRSCVCVYRVRVYMVIVYIWLYECMYIYGYGYIYMCV